MASAPPALHGTFDLAPRLLAVTDGVPETRGAGVVFIRNSYAQRLRPPDARGMTVVYEQRRRPSVLVASNAGAPAAARQKSRREGGASPAVEWTNLGFNCAGAALAWVGVVGFAALAPVTGGATAFGSALLYGGAFAASGQCAVSLFRVGNHYGGRRDVNRALDNNVTYLNIMRGADFIGLIGAAGGLLALRSTYAALSSKSFTFSQAMRPTLNQGARQRLTKALKIPGMRRAPAVMINRLVKHRLLEGAAGVVGLAGSSFGGNLNEAGDLVIWIVVDDSDL